MKFNPALLEGYLKKASFAFIKWTEATQEAGRWSWTIRNAEGAVKLRQAQFSLRGGVSQPPQQNEL